MKDYQREFIEFILLCKALRFGDFTLKSGRQSPYFFNAGQFNTGSHIGKLGEYYAKTIVDHYRYPKDYTVLFGPAYKGIPLVIATSIALAKHHGLDEIQYCFNRKEEKHHGEGGDLIGASLTGKKVLILDDVISAGITMETSLTAIQQHGGTPTGIVIAMDREEVSLDGQSSAMAAIEQSYHVTVCSIITLTDLMTYLQESAHKNDAWTIHLEKLKTYYQRYGFKRSA